MTDLTVTEQKVRYSILCHDYGQLLSTFDLNHWAVIEARDKLTSFLNVYLRASPFHLNQTYLLLNGETARFVKIHGEGTSYETMEDEAGVNRYTTRDFGRVTGSTADDVGRNIDLRLTGTGSFDKPLWWTVYVTQTKEKV
jgi:hypothetical protein